METVKVELSANVRFICPECGHVNRYSIAGEKPELVVCRCGERFKPEFNKHGQIG